MAKFKIIKGENKQWHCCLVANNNQIVFWTEGYANKTDAEYAAQWARANASQAPIEKNNDQ